MSQTRRLAAILAADVAGYSRLMGADEEGTLERLKSAAARTARPEDRRASRPHRQDHRRRLAGGVRQRRRCGALRGRGAARDGGAQRRRAAGRRHRVSHRHQSRRHHQSRSTTSTATASMSPHGSKPWPSRAGSASAASCATRCRDKLDFAFDDRGEQQVKNIAPAGPRIRSQESLEKKRHRRRIHRQERRCHCPTSRRSRCCRSPI